mmetsp:Transcript_22507/g.40421  ORF Transcript_22507/g.40421 Transcript_22507/m.40421 type:complete len:446 (-) Transcript_22507:39-1376(-)
MRVVEFYSGIGGHHAALKLALEATQDDGQSIHSKNSSITESRDESNDKFNVVRAFDMSEHAQATYEHYWKSPKVSRRNILFLKPELGVEYDELCHADLFIMSPPCQPYSRRKQKKHSQAPDRSGQEDRRAWSLHHLIERMQNDDDFLPRLLLLENVLGFENSESFEKLTAMFDARGFTWQAIVLSPHMLGIPNSRPRLFVLAKRNSSFAIPQWTNQVIQETETDPERRQAQTDNAQEHIFWVDQGSILKSILSDAGVSGDNIIPRESGALCPVRDFLEHNMSHEDRATFGIDPVVLWKAGNYFDVITPSSLRSSCFTKSYAYFHGGAGSVICNDLSAQEIQQVYEKFFTERNAIIEAAEPNKPNWKQVVEERGGCPTLESLKLRYFMPHEIARLLGFPEDFAFHPESSLRQRYALLGNSLSVHNVALLLRYLVAEPKLTNTDTQS